MESKIKILSYYIAEDETSIYNYFFTDYVLAKQKFNEILAEDFNNGLHRLGRITMILTMIILSAVPFVMAAYFGTKIDGNGFLAGFLKVAMIYMPVSLVEFLVY
mgnify:CR=1 FL=1